LSSYSATVCRCTRSRPRAHRRRPSIDAWYWPSNAERFEFRTTALIGELQAFEAVKTPSGMMRYSAPAGLHDDMVMALAFAWAGLVAGVPQAAILDPAQAGSWTRTGRTL